MRLAALLLLAFTAGAVLHPVMASTTRRIAAALHNRRVAKAIDTVLAEGYGITGLPDSGPNHLRVADTEVSTRPAPPLGFSHEGDWL